MVIWCHGGPTSSCQPGFDPTLQFFTTRGFAVACVDYAGSSGYGRAYRCALWGQWGVAWREGNLALYGRNSLVVTTLTVAATVLLGAAAAYALARMGPGDGKRTTPRALVLYLVGLVVPAQAAVVPGTTATNHVVAFGEFTSLRTRLSTRLPSGADGSAFPAVGAS